MSDDPSKLDRLEADLLAGLGRTQKIETEEVRHTFRPVGEIKTALELVEERRNRMSGASATTQGFAVFSRD